MAHSTTALLDYLCRIGAHPNGDLLRKNARVPTQMLIEPDVANHADAANHQRSSRRMTRRNGCRERIWETRVGEIPLSIAKLRGGTFFSSQLEPRKPSERVQLAVVEMADLEGPSTQEVDVRPQSQRLKWIDEMRGSLRSYVTVFVEEDDGRWQGEGGTAVRDGTQVWIVPNVAEATAAAVPCTGVLAASALSAPPS